MGGKNKQQAFLSSPFSPLFFSLFSFFVLALIAFPFNKRRSKKTLQKAKRRENKVPVRSLGLFLPLPLPASSRPRSMASGTQPPPPYRPGQWLRLWVLVLDGVQILPGEEATLPYSGSDDPLTALLTKTLLPAWRPHCIDRAAAIRFSQAMGPDPDAPLVQPPVQAGGPVDEGLRGDLAAAAAAAEGRGDPTARAAEDETPGEAREEEDDEDDEDDEEEGREGEEARRRRLMEPEAEVMMVQRGGSDSGSDSEWDSDEGSESNESDAHAGEAVDRARQRLWSHLLWLALERRQEQGGAQMPMAVAQCSFDDVQEPLEAEVGVLLQPLADAGGVGVVSRGLQRVSIVTLIASTLSEDWYLGLGYVLADVHRGFPWRHGTPPVSRPRVPRPELYERLALPPWALRQYDSYVLLSHARTLLRKLLQVGAGDVEVEGRLMVTPAADGGDVVCSALAMPDEPAEACLFLARVLPLTFAQRRKVVAMDSVSLRLRHLCQVMRELEQHATLDCEQCDSELADFKQVFVAQNTMSALGTYVNPNAYVHQIMTLREARNYTVLTRPTLEHTWFPHYAWAILNCDTCGTHIGWLYVLDPSVEPKESQLRRFFGLRRDVVRLGNARLDGHAQGMA
jgi:hypothetical protein